MGMLGGSGDGMSEFVIEEVSPVTGLRRRLPFQFSNREEAAAMAGELASSNPGFLFSVEVVPAA